MRGKGERGREIISEWVRGRACEVGGDEKHTLDVPSEYLLAVIAKNLISAPVNFSTDADEDWYVALSSLLNQPCT